MFVSVFMLLVFDVVVVFLGWCCCFWLWVLFGFVCFCVFYMGIF